MRDLNELALVGGAQQLTEEQYEAFLAEYNLTLPQSYKEFILFKNGGHSRIDSYDSGIAGYWHRVGEFFMIGEIWPFGERPEGISVRNVRSILEHLALVDNITSTLYPFAIWGAGDFYCIGKNDFKVYTIYQSDDEPTYVAPSFEAFIDGLEDIPDEG